MDRWGGYLINEQAGRVLEFVAEWGYSYYFNCVMVDRDGDWMDGRTEKGDTNDDDELS
jgi:hypothetical protein